MNRLGGAYKNGKLLWKWLRREIIALAQSGLRECDISRRLRMTHVLTVSVKHCRGIKERVILSLEENCESLLRSEQMSTSKNNLRSAVSGMKTCAGQSPSNYRAQSHEALHEKAKNRALVEGLTSSLTHQTCHSRSNLQRRAMRANHVNGQVCPVN